MNYFAIPGILLTQEEIRDNSIDKICRYFTTDYEQLIARSRKRKNVYVRQICMYALRKSTGYSQEYIGKLLGGRDHTTVIHACRTISDLLFSDPSTKADLIHLGLID